MERLYSVSEARSVLGKIGPTTFYGEVREGRLRTVHIGRRTFVSGTELQSYLERLAQIETGEPDATNPRDVRSSGSGESQRLSEGQAPLLPDAAVWISERAGAR